MMAVWRVGTCAGSTVDGADGGVHGGCAIGLLGRAAEQGVIDALMMNASASFEVCPRLVMQPLLYADACMFVLSPFNDSRPFLSGKGVSVTMEVQYRNVWAVQGRGAGDGSRYPSSVAMHAHCIASGSISSSDQPARV
jgi:hypothetical protein